MSKNNVPVDMVTLPLKEMFPVMQELLMEGQEVVLTVTGNSMSPFLRHRRDQVVLVAADPTALQPGDVPLIRRDNGQFVLHRIVERDDGTVRTAWGRKKTYPSRTDDLRYTLLGDAQWDLEPDVRPDQILAVATAFIRKGRRWDCASPAYRRNRLRWHRLLPLRRVWMWWDPRLSWRFRRVFPYRFSHIDFKEYNQ